MAESPRKRAAKVGVRARAAPRESAAAAEAGAAVEWLESRSSRAQRDGMARFAIPSDMAFGVSMGNIQTLARQLGRNHALAAELWSTGWYEARMLAAYVDEPDRVTPAQMDRWCRDFDNWAICDTVCFALFDRTPYAWSKVAQWSRRREEFVRRAAFALLWGLTTHDKEASDAPFIKALPLIERAAADERNFVRKAVNMAMRAIGKRSPKLHIAAVASARRLAASHDPSARWVGSNALRELTSSKVKARLASRRK